MNNSFFHASIHSFLASETEILTELFEIQKGMIHDRMLNNFMSGNPEFAYFNVYGTTDTEDMECKTAVDKYLRKHGICPQLAIRYPDAAREIALKQLPTLPSFIVSTQMDISIQPVTAQVSESALWWMQNYGPQNFRLHYLEKCIRTCDKIITKFRETHYYKSMSSLQRNHHRLITYLLNNSQFQPLSNALIDAYSMYLHTTILPDHHSPATTTNPTENMSATVTTNIQLNVPPQVLELHPDSESHVSDLSVTQPSQETQQAPTQNYHMSEKSLSGPDNHSNDFAIQNSPGQSFSQEQQEEDMGCRSPSVDNSIPSAQNHSPLNPAHPENLSTNAMNSGDESRLVHPIAPIHQMVTRSKNKTLSEQHFTLCPCVPINDVAIYVT